MGALAQSIKNEFGIRVLSTVRIESFAEINHKLSTIGRPTTYNTMNTIAAGGYYKHKQLLYQINFDQFFGSPNHKAGVSTNFTALGFSGLVGYDFSKNPKKHFFSTLSIGYRNGEITTKDYKFQSRSVNMDIGAEYGWNVNIKNALFYFGFNGGASIKLKPDKWGKYDVRRENPFGGYFGLVIGLKIK